MKSLLVLSAVLAFSFAAIGCGSSSAAKPTTPATTK